MAAAFRRSRVFRVEENILSDLDFSYDLLFFQDNSDLPDIEKDLFEGYDIYHRECDVFVPKK